MLDQQHRHIGRQGRDRIEDVAPLGLGHAGRRLVEQQHPRRAGEGHGDFEQTLLAVRQGIGAHVEHVAQTEARGNVVDLARDGIAGAQAAPPVAALPQPLANRQRQRLERREIGEELVDLERPHQPAPHPRLGAQVGDVLSHEKHLPGRRRQHAGEQVDEGRLARAVGTDQRLSRALLQAEGDVARRDQPAEALAQRAGLENNTHGLALASSPRTPPISRSRPTSASRTRNSPIQNSQNCGAVEDRRSCRTLKMIAPAMPP